MGRAKVPLKLIEGKSSRNSVYRKRLAGLKKKAHELSVLCDVPAAVISFDSCGKLDVWPENRDEIRSILIKYRSSGKNVLKKNKIDSGSVILSDIKKKETELNHLIAENNLLENKAIDFIDSKLREVRDRIALLSNNNQQLIEVEMPESCPPSQKFTGDDQNSVFSDTDVTVLDSLCQYTECDTGIDNSTSDYENFRSYTNCEQEHGVNQSAVKPSASESITEFSGYCDEGEDYSNLFYGLNDPVNVDFGFWLSNEERNNWLKTMQS